LRTCVYVFESDSALPGIKGCVKLIVVQASVPSGVKRTKKTYTARKEKTLSVKTLRRVRLFFTRQLRAMSLKNRTGYIEKRPSL
jgi:hypothetical protein